jgi:hypothetical protein
MGDLAVLVESGRQPHRVGKIDAGEGDGKHGIRRLRAARDEGLQGKKGNEMRRFRIKAEQKRT